MKLKNTFVLLVISLMLVAQTGVASAATLSGSEAASIPSSSSSPSDAAQILKRGPVYIDYANSTISVSKGTPTPVYAILRGYLPDPCHQLHVTVFRSDSASAVYITAYSLYDPNRACITVIQPFTDKVFLGYFSSGHWTVFVNSQKLGEFSVGGGISSSVN